MNEKYKDNRFVCSKCGENLVWMTDEDHPEEMIDVISLWVCPKCGHQEEIVD